MKTPMQELIEYLENQQNYYIEFAKENKAMKKGVDAILTATTTLKIKAKSLLEKEEKLFVNTFIDGEVNCGRQLAQDYYNEKFNNNDN